MFQPLAQMTDEDFARLNSSNMMEVFKWAVQLKEYGLIQIALANQEFLVGQPGSLTDAIVQYVYDGGELTNEGELHAFTRYLSGQGWLLLDEYNHIDHLDPVDRERAQAAAAAHGVRQQQEIERIRAEMAAYEASRTAQLAVAAAAVVPLPPPLERVGPSDYLNAAGSGDSETVSRYLEQARGVGRDIAQRETGNTALMLAASGGYRDVVDVLIDAKVNIRATNAAGENAAMIAERNGHVEIAAVLQQLITDLEVQERAASTSSTSASTTTQASSSNTFSDRLARLPEQVIPEWFKDVITLDIMNDPIVVDGRAFDRESLRGLFGNLESAVNPITRAEIPRSVLDTPSCINIRDMIDDYVTRRELEAKSQEKDVTAKFKEKMSELKDSHPSNEEASTSQPRSTG